MGKYVSYVPITVTTRSETCLTALSRDRVGRTSNTESSLPSVLVLLTSTVPVSEDVLDRTSVPDSYLSSVVSSTLLSTRILPPADGSRPFLSLGPSDPRPSTPRLDSKLSTTESRAHSVDYGLGVKGMDTLQLSSVPLVTYLLRVLFLRPCTVPSCSQST